MKVWEKLYLPGTTDLRGKGFLNKDTATGHLNRVHKGLFTHDFWNYGMFRGISQQAGKPVSPGTLGLLTGPDHPLFNSFPNEYHTNWQWFSIVKNSNPLILDGTPENYRPLVQVIDNLERNYKLGLIFEFRSGEGKLLLCISRLNNISDKPEASALSQSILGYMNTSRFDPEAEITPGELSGLFNSNIN